MGLPPVIDAHVHLFPDRVFEAVWRWFDRYGWPIRYKLHSPKVLNFLFARGIARVVALQYSHQPGMARMLNGYLAEIARASPAWPPCCPASRTPLKSSTRHSAPVCKASSCIATSNASVRTPNRRERST